MRSVATLQRNRDFGKMVEWALDSGQGFALPQLLGFVAAVALESDAAEFDFFRGAESSRCSGADLPHLHHLTDELHLISSQSDAGFPLLELNFLEPDIKPIHAAFSRRDHLIPNLRHAPPPPVAVPADCERMRADADAAARSVPLPLPLCEGNRTHAALAAAGAKGKAHGGAKARGRAAKAKDAGDVVWLIQEQKWETALAVVTDAILRNPEEPEMFLHRAYCEMHFKKYADAVLDCTRSLDLKRSEKAFRMRAACWVALGQRDLAILDMDEAADQGLPSAIPKKIKPHEQYALKAPAAPQAKGSKPTAK
jgi:tetratricopeptide (TPR) repeat protein